MSLGIIFILSILITNGNIYAEDNAIQKTKDLIAAFKAYDGSSKDTIKKSRTAIESILNLNTMFYLCIKSNWSNMDKKQKKLYLGIFAKIVRDTAYPNVKEFFKSANNEQYKLITKANDGSELPDTNVMYSCDAKIDTNNGKVEFVYNVIFIFYKKDDNLFVKDIVIDFSTEKSRKGVLRSKFDYKQSLVNNYVAVINSHVKKGGVDELISKMKEYYLTEMKKLKK